MVLRDGTAAACLPSQTTGAKRIRDTETIEHIIPPSMKPSKEQVKCPKCDKLCAPGARLASHQRLKHPNICRLFHTSQINLFNIQINSLLIFTS